MEELRENKHFVSLQNVEKIYPNGGKVVYDFNLDIEKNEFIVIVGPSGCGKSTTLRMIGGLEEITKGKLFIDKQLSNYTQSKDRKIAMVFQSYALYPQMTVYDNIAFPLKINKYPYPVKNDNGEVVVDEKGNPVIEMRKMTKEEIDEKVFSAAEILDLGPYMDRLPKELSGGQMQRVALGRAIVKNVPLFLMDEPLSNLDAKLRLVMRSEIVKLHNKIGATTIYVTHDQTEAMTMASRVVVMSKGFIQQIDSPEDIYNSPNNLFVAKFIGSPSMNIFEGVYDNGKIAVEGGIELKMKKDFIERHDHFYYQKAKEFKEKIENFDNSSEEYIRKILSALADDKAPIKVAKKKENIFAKIKKLFAKKEEISLQDKEEYKIAVNKHSELEDAARKPHKLILGIRPERVTIRKHDGEEVKNGIVVTATVCELLGAEYSVHFDLFGKDFVAKMDAKNKLTEGDKLVVEFMAEDIKVFDPITGDTI